MIPPAFRNRAIPDNVTVAAGTALSRITGFVRVIIFAWVLIPIPKEGRLADVYTLANTVPNVVYDLLIGGVLAATLVPRFTRAVAENDGPAIDAIMSVCLIALAVLTVAATLAAPWTIRVYTLIGSDEVTNQYQGVATNLAYFFLPQIFFYGATALFSALLNAKGRFFAAAWAPVIANIVIIIGFLIVKASFDDITIESTSSNGRIRLLLGLGATVGVALTAIALIPAVRRAGVALHFRPNFGHPAIREVIRLSTWTLGYVFMAQVTFLVITGLALREFSDYSAYSNMYLLAHVPHGLLAVTIMTTYTPRLTRSHVSADHDDYRALIIKGVQLIVSFMAPTTVLLVFAPDAVTALGGNVSTLEASAGIMRGLGAGLVAYSAYLFLLRGFYAMQNTRAAFLINLVQNILNISFGIIFASRWGAEGLAWAFTLSYSVVVFIAWIALDRTVTGGLPAGTLFRRVYRPVSAAAPMAVAVWATMRWLEPTGIWHSVVSLSVATLAGGVCYVGALAALGGLRRGSAPVG